ncbi:MAG: DUF2062 domain-containing protein [Xanthomonadales bacterium]|nr:DUF2062 domain-containing protein [Xanthomonadales bacterium]
MAFRAPTPEQIRSGQLGRLFGPRLADRRLWTRRRRSVALGMALGVFFGFLIPLGQFLFAGALAILLRANVPTALVSTLVTNPFTFGPVYYAAYLVGSWVLGGAPNEADVHGALAAAGSASGWSHWLNGVGAPLITGLALFACVGSTLAYVGVRWIWRFGVLRRRRRQRMARAARRVSLV